MHMDQMRASGQAAKPIPRPRLRQRAPALRRRGGALAAASFAALTLAACGGGASATTTTTTTQPSVSPSTSFSTASVPGIGTVLVDGSGRTVYELSSASTKNLPCTASTGCASVWTPLPLPSGTSSATASGGANSSLLATTSSGGATYPTYNGFVLYEFTGDTGPGQAGGQGISSFGGTWHVLDAAGLQITSASSSTTTTTYNY